MRRRKEKKNRNVYAGKIGVYIIYIPRTQSTAVLEKRSDSTTLLQY